MPTFLPMLDLEWLTSFSCPKFYPRNNITVWILPYRKEPLFNVWGCLLLMYRKTANLKLLLFYYLYRAINVHGNV